MVKTTVEFRHAITVAQLVLAVTLAGSVTVAAAGLSDLESARRNLAEARQAVAAATEEYRKMLATGGLTPTEKEDYQDYLGRLNQAVAENCNEIFILKSALADASAEAGCDQGRGLSSGPVSFPDERTDNERVVTLDARLSTSMSEFDELLLREMEELKRRQSGAADSAASSAGGSREGEGEESGEQPGQGTASSGKDGGETGKDPGGESGSERQGEDEVASREPESGQPQGGSHDSSRDDEQTESSSTRDGPPVEADDDIVARQLREAAESESDPVLREKLWEEYRRYKADAAATAAKAD